MPEKTPPSTILVRKCCIHLTASDLYSSENQLAWMSIKKIFIIFILNMRVKRNENDISKVRHSHIIAQTSHVYHAHQQEAVNLVLIPYFDYNLLS